MNSLSWRWLAFCIISCGLWLGARADPDDVAAVESPELDKKGLDNMQYFGRLGKRLNSELYGANDEDKRLDPSMFGRLGKRDNADRDAALEDFDSDSLLKKRFDSRAYFGRLGKRYDTRMFLGKLGKRNQDSQQILRQLADLAKRGVDTMAYFGRLGKRPFDQKQFYGRLG